MKYIMKFWKKWAARRIVRLMKSNHLKKEKAESHLLGEHGLWMVLLRSSSPAFCVPCSPNPCILQQGLLQFAVLLCMLYVLQDIFCPGPLGLFCLPLWQSSVVHAAEPISLQETSLCGSWRECGLVSSRMWPILPGLSVHWMLARLGHGQSPDLAPFLTHPLHFLERHPSPSPSCRIAFSSGRCLWKGRFSRLGHNIQVPHPDPWEAENGIHHQQQPLQTSLTPFIPSTWA